MGRVLIVGISRLLAMTTWFVPTTGSHQLSIVAPQRMWCHGTDRFLILGLGLRKAA